MNNYQQIITKTFFSLFPVPRSPFPIPYSLSQLIILLIKPKPNINLVLKN